MTRKGEYKVQLELIGKNLDQLNRTQKDMSELRKETSGFQQMLKVGLGIDFAGRFTQGIGDITHSFTGAIRRGLDFNRTMFDAEVGISNVLKKFLELDDAAAKQEAAKSMQAIIALEPQTAAGLSDLVQGFLATVSSAQAVGVQVDQNIDLVGRAHPRFKPIGPDSEHLFGYHPNVLKQVGKPEHRDQIWVADTTYLLSDAGGCSLATVMDLCTRRIVGWSISTTNDAERVCTALENAALTRDDVRAGIVPHSDRGSTYASDRYQRVLARFKMHPSMSARGNWYPAHAARRWNRSSDAIKPPQCAITFSPTKLRCAPTSATPSKSSTTDTANTPRWATSVRCKPR